MKQIMKLFVLMLVLTMILASCGGGDDTPGAPTVAFTKTVELTGGAGVSAMPFGTTNLRQMLLYRASEMKGTGTITAVSFKYFGDLASAVSCPNVTIKMGHTAQNVLNASTTFANNIETGQGSQQTVLASSTVNIPAGTSGNYYTIALATPYHYNGVDNLVIEVSRPACTGDVPTSDHDYDGSTNIALFNQTDAAATTGELGPWLPDAKFAFSNGDNTITYDGVGGNSIPFKGSHKVQLLYPAAEINSPGGIINGIAFRVSGGTTGTGTVTVTLGHNTGSAGLSQTFADNFNSGTPVVVANARTFTFPGGTPNGAYVWLPLPDATFNYNGKDNIVVQIETSNDFESSDISWSYGDTGTGTRVYGNPGDLVAPNPADDIRHFIKFRFAGGPVDVITPESTEQAAPFNAVDDNKLQHLYRAAELGTKGTITKVAFRLSNADSNNTAYNSFAVVLGHSGLITPELGTTFSANMADAQTVFSGTYTVPAGLKIGDWIEIPLSTPFAYDGTRDLVVQVSTLKGAAENRIKMSLDATRYKSRRAFTAGSNTTDTANWVQDDLADLRLIMQ